MQFLLKSEEFLQYAQYKVIEQDIIMIEKNIARKIGKAIFDYKMIDDKDRILVAVSGGKDSLTLLKDLAVRMKSFPIKYEIEAIHIETDFCSCCKKNKLEAVFKEVGVPYHIFPVPVMARLKPGKTMNCYWCSNQRRLELMKFAEENNFNKIALGHHLDDIAETLLMNVMLKGDMAGMLPVMKYRKYPCTIIRPLAYVREEEIIEYSEKTGISSVVCTCPYGQKSKRKEIRSMIREVSSKNPNVQENILKAMHNVDMDYLLGKKPSAEESNQ